MFSLKNSEAAVWRCSVEKVFFRKKSYKIIGKHLCQSLLFNKVTSLSQAYNFIKKETLAQVFSYEFCEISKNTFFTGHPWATVSVSIKLEAYSESSQISIMEFFAKTVGGFQSLNIYTKSSILDIGILELPPL